MEVHLWLLQEHKSLLQVAGSLLFPLTVLSIRASDKKGVRCLAYQCAHIGEAKTGEEGQVGFVLLTRATR